MAIRRSAAGRGTRVLAPALACCALAGAWLPALLLSGCAAAGGGPDDPGGRTPSADEAGPGGRRARDAGAGGAADGASGRAGPAERDFLTDLEDDGSLVAGLNAQDPAVRRVAARGLARMTGGDPAPALRARLAIETDPAVLAEIAFALGRRPDAESAEALWRLVGGPDAAAKADTRGARHDPLVQERAILAFARHGRDADPATSRLGSLLRLAEDPGVRGAAALALFRLDGRRSTHARQASEPELRARDAELARAAAGETEPAAGVRWRAAYALASLRGHRGHSQGLAAALLDPAEPLARLFALRGLGALHREGRLDPAAFAKGGVDEALERALADADARVGVEAARALAVLGSLGPLLEAARHESSHVRLVAVESLRERLLATREPPAPEERRTALSLLVSTALQDASPMVRREALAAVARCEDEPGGAGPGALHILAVSDDPRDRARAAQLLAEGACEDAELLETLSGDAEPAVVAATLAPPRDPDTPEDEDALRRRGALVERLLLGLRHADTAPRATAAEAAQPLVAAGSAPPELLRALAEALDEATGFENKEARLALRRALELPDEPVRPSAPPPAGRLLDRLLAEDRAAREDPAPRVLLETSRGTVTLELDRVNAPRHTASFLELAEAGVYDGLDFHRVVPNFVVQGLDPRGDGYGTGGRRLPDEINPLPFVTGTLGMPNAGEREPHTGGCQIFITLVPTPHLDGAYTAFGRVVEGLDVVQRLEIGDRVARVRRVD